MVIGKSEIEWHDAKELPNENEDLLILAADEYLTGVYCGQYEYGELGFHIPDNDCREVKFYNVLGWAYFPTVHILAVDKNGKPNVLKLG